MDTLIKMFSGQYESSYIVLSLIVVFCCYRAVVIFWTFRSKSKELKNEMEYYINNLIDTKTSPILSRLNIANHRIDDLEKLRLPTKLIAIETKLEILTSNVEAGFKRIEEDIRTFHRKP